jgi:hypothetical protein
MGTGMETATGMEKEMAMETETKTATGTATGEGTNCRPPCDFVDLSAKVDIIVEKKGLAVWKQKP